MNSSKPNEQPKDKSQTKGGDLTTDKEKQADSQKEWKNPDEPVRGGKGPRSPGGENEQGDR